MWRHLDMVALALALPAFAIAGFPLGGWALAAGAWLAQWGVRRAAEGRAAGASERSTAVGLLAGSIVVRLWVVTAPILVVGLLAGNEVGLAAAILVAGLVTLHLAGEALSRLLAPDAKTEAVER
jgi:hypothetical protein